jgi:hypothetical protein
MRCISTILQRTVWCLPGRALVAWLLVAATSPHPVRSQEMSPCGATSLLVPIYVKNLKRFISSTDSMWVAFRSRIGVSLAPPDSVVTVSDTTVCRSLLNAYNLVDTTQTSPASQIHVVRVQTRYIVTNPLQMAGEFMVHYVFDTAYVFREAFFH